MTRTEIQELNVLLREDRIPAELMENMFVCKLCRTFCSIKQKTTDSNYLENHKSHKAFCKDYKKRLYIHLGLEMEETEDSPTKDKESVKTPKKIHQVSQSDNPTKITIKTTTLDVSNEPRPSRKRRTKEFASPSSESRIHVTDNGTNENDPNSTTDKASVTIQFDLNTKKLWQDLHFPYGNYTSFFRHLILLEKYWRNGDLTLSDNAQEKASVYIKSVHNRIKAYEGRHKKTEIDLSASTRPDLSVPPLSAFIHEPLIIDDDDQDPSYKPPSVPTATSTSASKPANNMDDDEPNLDSSTILKIPKIPIRPISPVPEQPLPTKIRVRTDLMHLGLMAKPASNIMDGPLGVSSGGSKSNATVTQPPVTPPTSSSNNKKKLSPHTISSMLNNGPSSSGRNSSLIQLLNNDQSKGAQQQQSSNSQLFKNSDQGTGSAIPLTFNNSIAEVLAAANKANKAKETSVSERIASKPEITITAKPLASSTATSTKTTSSSVAGSAFSAPSDFRPGWPDDDIAIIKTKTNLASPSPSGGGGQVISSKANSAAKSHTNPLIDMSKLLATQSPGLPPHLVAQNHLGTTMSKTTPNSAATAPSQPNLGATSGGGVISKTIPSQMRAPKAIHPPQTPPQPRIKSPGSSIAAALSMTSPNSSSSAAAASNNVAASSAGKKNINNILDRLSNINKSNSPTKSSSGGGSSSLVRQLQAPTIAAASAGSSQSSHPHLPNVAAATSRNSQQQLTKQQKQAQQQQQALAAASQLNEFMLMNAAFNNPAAGAAAAGMVGQPMVQYPDWNLSSLVMAGAIPGMNQVQAAQRAQALTELMSLSLSQAAKNTPNAAAAAAAAQGNVAAAAAAAAAAARIRAPPPLTHMGGKGLHKPKND